MNNFEFIVRPAILICAYLLKKHELKGFNLFNMQSEFAALHGAIHDFMNLRQEFEQMKNTNYQNRVQRNATKKNLNKIFKNVLCCFTVNRFVRSVS